MSAVASACLRLCTALVVCSLLLCLGVCSLWVNSYRGGDALSRLLGHDRYTLHSHQGQIKLLGPPPTGEDIPALRDAELRVAAIRNDQVYWSTWFTRPADRHPAAKLTV